MIQGQSSMLVVKIQWLLSSLYRGDYLPPGVMFAQ